MINGQSVALLNLVVAPLEVVFLFGFDVLVDQLPHGLAALVELVEAVAEHGVLAVLVHEGLPGHQLVVLVADALEELSGGNGTWWMLVLLASISPLTL